MHLINFSISKDAITIEQGSNHFDLHNNFNLQSLVYNPILRTLELSWSRGEGEWIQPDEADRLRMVFTGVYLFKAHEQDQARAFDGEDCLDSLGFIWDNMISEMHTYVSSQASEGCTHLNFIFMSGFGIKVGADTAYLHVQYELIYRSFAANILPLCSSSFNIDVTDRFTSVIGYV